MTGRPLTKSPRPRTRADRRRNTNLAPHAQDMNERPDEGAVPRLYRLKTFSPREMPDTPVRTVSRIAASPTACKKASSLSLVPVI